MFMLQNASFISGDAPLSFQGDMCYFRRQTCLEIMSCVQPVEIVDLVDVGAEMEMEIITSSWDDG
jgi:hypothetical protein